MLATEAWTQWLTFCIPFLLDSNFVEVSFKISQQASIGSGNGLAMNKRQANIWTKDAPINVCITKPHWIEAKQNNRKL